MDTYTLKVDYDDAEKIVVSMLSDLLNHVLNEGYHDYNDAERIELADALMKVLKQFTVPEQMAEIIEEVYDL